MNDVSVYLGRRGEGPNQKNAFCACTPRFEPGVVHFYTSQTFETLALGPKLQDKIMLTMAVSLVYVPSHTQNSQIKKRGRSVCGGGRRVARAHQVTYLPLMSTQPSIAPKHAVMPLSLSGGIPFSFIKAATMLGVWYHCGVAMVTVA